MTSANPNATHLLGFAGSSPCYCESHPAGSCPTDSSTGFSRTLIQIYSAPPEFSFFSPRKCAQQFLHSRLVPVCRRFAYYHGLLAGEKSVGDCVFRKECTLLFRAFMAILSAMGLLGGSAVVVHWTR